MDRAYIFNCILDKLTYLAYMIEVRGKLNLLDLNIHSENFFALFLNLLYGWNLKNLNQLAHNVEAIDLIDESRHIIVQVTSTDTKQKIESTLKKEGLKAYNGYTIKFMFISKNVGKLKTQVFSNPNNFSIEIFDIISLSKDIEVQDIKKLDEINQFLEKEIPSRADAGKIDSNLASIVNILSKEELKNISDTYPKVFDIDNKIVYNDLVVAGMVINDYKIYYKRINQIYQEYDAQGINKSYSVLNKVRNLYLELISCNEFSADGKFFGIIKEIKQLIIQSKNYKEMPVEELELCINIIIADAFISCKIFENPEGYEYVTS